MIAAPIKKIRDYFTYKMLTDGLKFYFCLFYL